MAEPLTNSQNEALDVGITFTEEFYQVLYAAHVAYRDDQRFDRGEKLNIGRVSVGAAYAMATEIIEAIDANVKVYDMAVVFKWMHDNLVKARQEGEAGDIFPALGA